MIELYDDLQTQARKPSLEQVGKVQIQDEIGQKAKNILRILPS